MKLFQKHLCTYLGGCCDRRRARAFRVDIPNSSNAIRVSSMANSGIHNITAHFEPLHCLVCMCVEAVGAKNLYRF